MSSMKKKHFFIVLLLVSFNINNSFAQKNISRKNQEWIQYYNSIKLSKKFILKTDGGYRLKNGFSDPSQYISRIGLGYKAGAHIQVTAGFAHLGVYTNLYVSKREYRPYQELLINDKYDKVTIQHRFRIEERFFTTSTKNTYYNRFRYRFMVKIPVLDFSDKRKGSGLYLNLADEVFVHAGKEVVYNAFGANRVLLGTTFNLNESLGFTFTYNSEFASTTTAGSFNYSDIFWLGIKHKINLYKKKKNEIN